MEDLDIGVVWDVLSKDFVNKRTGADVTNERILYGGPIIADLSKEVGSLGELLLNTLYKFSDKVAFVSEDWGKEGGIENDALINSVSS